MPDIGQVRRGLNESLAELSEAADEIENSIAPDKPKKSSTKRSPKKSPNGKANGAATPSRPKA